MQIGTRLRLRGRFARLTVISGFSVPAGDVTMALSFSNRWRWWKSGIRRVDGPYRAMEICIAQNGRPSNWVERFVIDAHRGCFHCFFGCLFWVRCWSFDIYFENRYSDGIINSFLLACCRWIFGFEVFFDVTDYFV